MAVNYSFSEEAERDLYLAVCYFKLTARDELFLDDITGQLKKILAMPEAFQVRYKSTRIVPLSRFRYSIHYTVFKGNIYILRVLNQKQDF